MFKNAWLNTIKYSWIFSGVLMSFSELAAQPVCDSTRVSKVKMYWCYESEFGRLNPDSIAKAHRNFNRHAYYLIIPGDSMIRKNTMILIKNGIFDEKKAVVLNSVSQGRKRRFIIYMNPDYSTGMMSFRDTIRHGRYWHYYFPYVINETGKYKEGVQNGRWMHWDSTGKLQKVKFYKKGVEKKTLEGRKLKSLRLFRLGPMIQAGSQHINVLELNSRIRQETTLYDPFEPGNLLLNYGVQMGNPSSLSAHLFYKILANKTTNGYGLGGKTVGGLLNYTFWQTKNLNFRLGSGIEFPELYFLNSVEYHPPQTGSLLSNKVVVNRNAMVVDVSFSISPRRLRFQKKTCSDYQSFIGMQIGYSFTVNNGNYYNENGVQLNFDKPLYYLNGFHFSIYLAPFII